MVTAGQREELEEETSLKVVGHSPREGPRTAERWDSIAARRARPGVCYGPYWASSQHQGQVTHIHVHPEGLAATR